MSQWTKLLENGDPIDDLIGRAKFTENDRDSATSGYCGTFAIALHQMLNQTGVSNRLVLFCLLTKNGEIKIGSDGIPYWRHVVVQVGNTYYDVYGRQETQWIIDEYFWRYPFGGAPMPVSEKDLTHILDNTQVGGSHSRGYFEEWLDKLEKAA
jgi:hypothetical protein